MEYWWDPHEWYKCKGCGWTQHLLTLGWCDRCNYSERCEWCGWWGYFGWHHTEKYRLIHGSRGTLCLPCWYIEEPHVRPHNRDLCHSWLLQMFRTPTPLAPDVHRLIAEYLAKNTPAMTKDAVPPRITGLAEKMPTILQAL